MAPLEEEERGGKRGGGVRLIKRKGNQKEHSNIHYGFSGGIAIVHPSRKSTQERVWGKIDSGGGKKTPVET